MENKKLTFCGACYDCGAALSLVTVHEYFTDEILGYRGFCKHCNKRTDVFSSVDELINKKGGCIMYVI